MIDRNSTTYNKKVFGGLYALGELVYLLNPKVPKSTIKKLFHPWTGPFKVLKKLSECSY